MNADEHLDIKSTCGATGEDWLNQAQITAYGASGTAIDEKGPAVQQADCSTLSYALYDATADMSVVNPSTSITVSSAISNTLTDDDVWTTDEIGRNFIHSIPGSLLSKHNHQYVAVYLLTLTGGQVKKLIYKRMVLDPTVP